MKSTFMPFKISRCYMPVWFENSDSYRREKTEKLKPDQYRSEKTKTIRPQSGLYRRSKRFKCNQNYYKNTFTLVFSLLCFCLFMIIDLAGAETLQQPLNIKSCNIVASHENLMDGSLSDYWAQELIGSDLLREELIKTPHPDIENWIAVYDVGADHSHSILVSNLISDNRSQAVLPGLSGKALTAHSYQKLTAAHSDFTASEEKKEKKKKLIKELIELSEKKPHYINNSMGWISDNNIGKFFQILFPSSVLITAAGNEFDQTRIQINQKLKSSRNFNTIIIGSFSPTGYVSRFSNSAKEVHIMAPSDTWIISADKDKYVKFGGTSGAAPLVTGSLAAFEWLSAYHPTPNEAKVLLEKTAFPTLHSHEEPQINGAGLLNTYKLGKVGSKLRIKCQDKGLICYQKGILEEDSYHFGWDEGLKEDLATVFPSCVMGSFGISPKISSCEQKAEVFKRLRAAILLDPSNSSEYLKILSCIYKEGGFLQNAVTLDRLALALESRETIRAFISKTFEKDFGNSDILRLMLGMGGFEEELLLYFEKTSPFYKGQLLLMAGGIGESALFLFEKAFKEKFHLEEHDNRKYFISGLSKIGKPALPLLGKAFNTGDPKLRKEIVDGLGWIGEPALPLLEKAFNTGDPELQKEIVDQARTIGTLAALPLLEKAFETGDLDLKKRAIEDLSVMLFSNDFNEWGEFVFAINDSGLQEEAKKQERQMLEIVLPILEKAFNTGDPELRKEVVRMASRYIGEPALPLLEKVLDTDDTELKKKVVWRASSEIGEPALPLLEKALDTDDPELRKEVVLMASSEIGEPALPLLEKVLDTDDTELKKAVVLRASRHIGEPALPLLEKVLDTDEPELREEVVLIASSEIGEPALPLLEKAFNTGDPELRKAVVLRASSEIGEPALPLLEKVLDTDDTELKKAVVLRAFSEIGEPALPLLEKVLDTDDTELKKEVILLLRTRSEVPAVSVLPLLEKALNTGDPELQKMVIGYVCRLQELGFHLLEKAFAEDDIELKKVVIGIGSAMMISPEGTMCGEVERALPLMRKAFDTEDPGLQESVMYTMARFKEPRLFYLLKKGFNNGNPNVQLGAVYAASKIRDPVLLPLLEGAVPLMKKIFDTGNPDIQKKTISVIGTLKESSLFHLLEKGFDTGNPDIQKKTISVIGTLKESSLFHLLEKGFDTGNPDIQKETISVIGTLKESSLFHLLEKGFDTGNPDIQKETISVIGTLKESSLFHLLEKGFDTGNPDIQKETISIISTLKESSLFHLLEKGFYTGHPDIQKAVISAVEKTGDPVLLPLLEKAFKIVNPELKQKVARVGNRIGKKKIFDINDEVEMIYIVGNAYLTANKYVLFRHLFDVLKRGLDNDNPDTQKAVISVIGTLKEPRLFHLLEKGFYTGNPDIQKAVISAVEKTGDPVLLPLLEKAFKIVNPELKQMVARVGNKIGKKDLFLLEENSL